MFREYTHIERFGNDEVQGLELGECYVFPKLDGTNASIWIENGEICAGSRKRQLSETADNAGFFQWTQENADKLREFFYLWPNFRLYGEWLVPHTFKKYRKNAWRKFYIFDVFDDAKESYLPYDRYELITLHLFDIVPPLCIIYNATYDSLLVEMKNNGFLVEDGTGYGEGIVIKNYSYTNRFGRLAYAKIVSQEFKDRHPIAMGATKKTMGELVELAICDKYITPHLVEKTYSKLVNENGGWSNKQIPRLLGTVYHDLVTEELWAAIKEFKHPTINFRTLNNAAIIKVKQLLPHIF